MSRHEALVSAALLPVALARVVRGSTAAADDPLTELETSSRGRLGVATLDIGSGLGVSHRAGERFPMCSTFKLLAAAAVLARVDRGVERVDRRVPFTAADLLDYAPVTKTKVADGSMTIAELCDAAITVSDNTAGNLLLASVGGPAGLTAYTQSLGDTVTRLDRNEPTLNEATPGDVRDTTSPAAMLGLLRTLLLGTALKPASRQQLVAWLIANTTGGARLRAGAPGAKVGDKTGTGEHGTTNDVGIIWPPGREPILVAAFLTNTTRDPAAREAVLASVGRIAVSTR